MPGVRTAHFRVSAVSAERSDLPALVEGPAPVTTATLRSALVVPAMVANAGDRAARRFLEFFAASIENDNTCLAYYRAVSSFFAWLDQHGIGELPDIEPFHVAAYLKALRVSAAGNPAAKERVAAKLTVKQHLAAIRMLLDWLIVGQVLAINPAHAVRGPKHVVKRGKTPVLSEDQARLLLGSIKVRKTKADGSETAVPSLVGLRDRALIGVMVYSFARISAVVAMQVEDYFANGKRWWLRLHEKGGKRHEMPVHHKLEQFLDDYLDAAGIRGGGKTPLFPLGSGPNRDIDRAADASHRRLSDGPPAHRRSRLEGQARLPRVSGDRHHCLSRSRRHAQKRPGDGRARKPAHDQAVRSHRRPDHPR
jgi:integrase/recombinase XerD